MWRSLGEVGQVVRDQRIGSPVCCGIQHQLVFGISKLGPPGEMHLDRLHRGGERGKGRVHLCQGQARDLALLRPF